MIRRSVEVEEHARSGALVGPLSSEREAQRAAAALRRASAGWRRRLGLPRSPFDVEVRGSYLHVRAFRVTGVIPIGSYDVYVVPKYLAFDPSRRPQWRRALLEMLVRSGSGRFLLTDTVSSRIGDEPTFVELLAFSYAATLDDALREGIPRAYEPHSGQLTTVRGRLLVDRMYPQVLRAPQYVPCVYSAYVVDSPVTRLLKWAALEFAGLVSRPTLAQRLYWLAARLPASRTQIPAPLVLDRLALSHQYRHCEPAVRIALWLARGKGGRLGGHDEALPGVLLDSWRVFEDLVTAAIKRVCALSGWTFRRRAVTLAVPTHSGRRLSALPDGEIRRQSQSILVTDAKYKSWSGAPRAVDVYQVMAAGRIRDSERAVLVFPAPTSGRCEPLHWRVKGDGTPVLVSALFVDPLELAAVNGFDSLVHGLRDGLEQALATPISTAAAG